MRITPMFPLVAACTFTSALRGQVPDSAAHLPGITVNVTRTPTPLSSLGAAVTRIDSAAILRGRLSTGLDETLGFVPGVVAENRWNYSVDQRISIRGFGARANFGLRGVKVLLDGVPQTLPDGQSQLNNVNLDLVDHIEVLRGAASALYGNAGGGVLSFTTNPVPSAPSMLRVSAEGGTFGTAKEEVIAGARFGTVGGTLAFSNFSTDGFRQQSEAAQRRASLGVDWKLDPLTTITFRASGADDPKAQNPGALTAAEVAAQPDSASANNIRRGADKSVKQGQVAIGYHHIGNRVLFDVTTFSLVRSLENPLTTPPPAPTNSLEGTWSGIDRLLGGVRASATLLLDRLSLTLGVDAQSLRDDRVNKRSVSGVATDTILVNQREKVTEVGPFVQASVPMGERVTLRAGGRLDANHFAVEDHFLTDGDASAARTMNAASGNGGVTVKLSRDLLAWSDAATVFETPTTTELANRPDGQGGFNPDLGPQRSVSEEVGMRGRRGRVALDLAVYHTTTHDAIVPYSEVAGRSYFRNVGSLRTQGAEAGVSVTIHRGLALLGTWTFTDAKFTDYKVVSATSTDTLDGRQLAGLPRTVGRVGVRGTIGGGFTIDVDQAFASGMFGDDDNTIKVDGWGGGVTGARLGWHGRVGGAQVSPFVAALNLFDKRYVGSVTTNGAAGRVFEPAAGRTIYIGASVQR